MSLRKPNPGAPASATGADVKAGGLPAKPTTLRTVRKDTRQAKWAAENPLKVWAHAAYRAAKRKGLIEPKPCEECGSPDSEAHHPHYLRPLDVVFLCHRCHQRRHAAERRAGA